MLKMRFIHSLTKKCTVSISNDMCAYSVHCSVQRSHLRAIIGVQARIDDVVVHTIMFISSLVYCFIVVVNVF